MVIVMMFATKVDLMLKRGIKVRMLVASIRKATDGLRVYMAGGRWRLEAGLGCSTLVHTSNGTVGTN
jgi:hypothetical protein